MEEVAFRKGFISGNHLKELASPLVKSGYGKYLMQVLEQQERSMYSHMELVRGKI